MNLINILYEPYVIILFISLIITIFAYFIIKNNANEEDQKNKVNLPKTLLITFLISFILLNVLKYAIAYMNKNGFFQKGGVDVKEHLTAIADDVDFDIIEN